MKKEILEEKIQKKAGDFKSRALISPTDRKRHDSIKSDERREHYTAYHKMGWSYAKIAEVFNRDPRTVKTSVEKEQGILDKRG